MKTYLMKRTSSFDYTLYNENGTAVTAAEWDELFGTAGEACFVIVNYSQYYTTQVTLVAPSGATSGNKTVSLSESEKLPMQEGSMYKGAWNANTGGFTSFTNYFGNTLSESQISFLMNKIKNAGPGKAKVLTSADFNYPTDNPNCIALWLLSPGFYTTDSTSFNKIKPELNSNLEQRVSGIILFPFVSYAGEYYGSEEILFQSESVNNQPEEIFTYVVGTDGREISGRPKRSIVLTRDNVIDNLTAFKPELPLSANQGRILNNKIEGRIIAGAGAPTSSTVGTVGMIYEDTTNGKLYQCTAVTPGTDPDPDTYTWEEVGGGPTVVQTTGTSTTDVMSQKATTLMIYNGGDGKKVEIGTNSAATANWDVAILGTANQEHAIAIGATATANANGGIALGMGANASTQGVFDVGLSNASASAKTANGYNGSAYRLLSGLYDPQNAHDAATKGYVDNSIPATFTTNEWNALWA